MTKREGLALICALTRGTRRRDQIPGTKAGVCSECGKSVWLAPSGQDILATREGAFPLCTTCGLDAIASDPDPTIHPPTGEQEDELARWREHHA